jgi:hypothetical protein
MHFSTNLKLELRNRGDVRSTGVYEITGNRE